MKNTNFASAIIEHIRENFQNVLKKRIKNLVEITDKTKDINISKFQLNDNGFYVEGHTFIETKEIYKGSTNISYNGGVDTIPVDFRFKITVANNQIIKSEVRFNITKMGNLIYENGVVTQKFDVVPTRKSL